MRVFMMSAGAALLALLLLALVAPPPPVAAQACASEWQSPPLAERNGPPGSEVRLGSFVIPARAAQVTVTVVNNESIHPGTSLIFRAESGEEFVIPGIENRRNTTIRENLPLRGMITVFFKFGPDGETSFEAGSAIVCELPNGTPTPPGSTPQPTATETPVRYARPAARAWTEVVCPVPPRVGASPRLFARFRAEAVEGYITRWRLYDANSDRLLEEAIFPIGAEVRLPSDRLLGHGEPEAYLFRVYASRAPGEGGERAVAKATIWAGAPQAQAALERCTAARPPASSPDQEQAPTATAAPTAPAPPAATPPPAAPTAAPAEQQAPAAPSPTAAPAAAPAEQQAPGPPTPAAIPAALPNTGGPQPALIPLALAALALLGIGLTLRRR